MVIVGFGAIFGVLQVISRIFARFGLQSAQNSVVDIAGQNPTIFLLLVPLSFILIGPGEELLYRGLIQGILRKSFSPVRAIILASLLFAAIHIFSLQGQLQGKLVYLSVVFALALVLGSLYEYTDNLAVPALVHGAYNATLFGFQYLIATGMIPR
ncbi:CPBP family intramembrane glutamic endopeptidase [Haladaptatus sp. DYF46]|uniref:CPBP family intramembrane glutamic endopeptidase n=1 Tax=Haladaptatus sp. DYF46 TaxID=2886041 RepID=UPI001E320735|nr:CPBP family intramembrane glutamic endopeptidase [Haladaptatus sp. DYF46]